MFFKEREEKIAYGTAGYRAHHQNIWDIVDRAYLVCAIRSCSVQRPVGMVLTASHNPMEDNGIKYVEYNGNMFSTEWEQISDEVVGCPNEGVESLLKKYPLTGSVVFISRDTRDSGESMVEKCVRAAEFLGPKHHLFDLGITTTPHMHFIVREMYAKNITLFDDISEKTGRELLSVYYQRIEKFCALVQRVYGVRVPAERVLDSANGVGRNIFLEVCAATQKIVNLSILVNDKNLNESCGSDYIKTTGKAPSGVHAKNKEKTIKTNNGEKKEKTFLCAYDGDCDRIVYFDPAADAVLDGDRLCVVLASYLVHLLSAAHENVCLTSVVTAYSNGRAMEALRDRGTLKVGATGVKNMQREASKHMLSVWFENNGHGTVWSTEAFRKKIAARAGYVHDKNLLDLEEDLFEKEMARMLARAAEGLKPAGTRVLSPYSDHFGGTSEQEALLLLHGVLSLVDPYIGDAVVNMCLIEAVFYAGFIAPEGVMELYKDLPCVLQSVKGCRSVLNDVFVQSVADRYTNLRIHLRASGTEDLVRIYIEGEDSEEIKDALEAITEAVQEKE